MDTDWIRAQNEDESECQYSRVVSCTTPYRTLPRGPAINFPHRTQRHCPSGTKFGWHKHTPGKGSLKTTHVPPCTYLYVCLHVCVCVCVCIVHVHCTCIHEYIECVCNRLFQASSLSKRIFSEKPKHMGRKKRKVIQNLTFILCPPLCAVQPRSMYILLVADPRSQWKRSPLINAH